MPNPAASPRGYRPRLKTSRQGPTQVHEFLEYPRRIYTTPANESSELVFTEGQRVRGFTWINDTDTDQTVLFQQSDALITYFTYFMPKTSGGFVPVQFFAHSGLSVVTVVVDKEVNLAIFVATPGGSGEVIEL